MSIFFTFSGYGFRTGRWKWPKIAAWKERTNTYWTKNRKLKSVNGLQKYVRKRLKFPQICDKNGTILSLNAYNSGISPHRGSWSTSFECWGFTVQYYLQKLTRHAPPQNHDLRSPKGHTGVPYKPNDYVSRNFSLVPAFVRGTSWPSLWANSRVISI